MFDEEVLKFLPVTYYRRNENNLEWQRLVCRMDRRITVLCNHLVEVIEKVGEEEVTDDGIPRAAEEEGMKQRWGNCGCLVSGSMDR